MKPSKPKLTPEQIREQERAEADRLRSIQTNTADRTALFRRISSPRLGIMSGGRKG
jgi:hypothetical protein